MKSSLSYLSASILKKRRVDFEKLMKQNLDNINENIEDVRINIVHFNV